jgi:glycopeptide antibiotics resistance protein
MALAWILLFKLGVQFSYMERRTVNLIPFNEALTGDGKIDLPEIILNVVIFVPLGLYAGILFRKWSFQKQLLFYFLVSLLIEGLQFILGAGAFDTTDIVTNTLGGIIGLLLFKAIEKAFNDSNKAQKFVNLIAAIGTASLIAFLFLLKMQMLPVRYQ